MRMLRNISKTYDPLGLISPLAVSLKLLAQKVWTMKLDWDEEFPTEIVSSREALSSDCQRVSQINFTGMS